MSRAEAVPPSRAARALGRVAVHPVLLAAYPGLALWSINVNEVLPGDVWPTLWLPTVVTLVAWGLASLALRSARRGAVVASVAAVVALNAGRVAGAEPGRPVLWIGIGIIVAAVVVAWRIRGTSVGPVTAIANVLALVLVVMTAPPILSAWGPGRGAVSVPPALADAGGLAGRDIWYIIPDRYPRADTLAEEFGFDNSPFLDGLEERGFQVADRALANYPKTAHSLAATWNLDPVDVLVPEPPADGADWQPLYALLRDHRLGQVLTGAGYEYVHLGTWWSPTATAESADRVLRVDTFSEFQSVWQSQTIAPAVVVPEDEGEGDLSLRQLNRRYTSFQLDQLDRLAQTPQDRPRFVLAHVTLPHEPYVFDADGSLVTADQARARSREENIANHVRYLNSRLEDLVDELLDGPPESWPVIVIQSDEGPHPAERTGPSYDWTTAPDGVVAEKLRTLSAILLPGSDLQLPEDLTGVNTWRYVLDEAIGTDFGVLPDPPVEVFPGEDQLYDLHDVRDRVS